MNLLCDTKTPVQPDDLESRLLQKMSEILPLPSNGERDPAKLTSPTLDSRAVSALIANGLTEQEAEWIIPWQSLRRHQDSPRLLTDEESSRLIQVARVLCLAMKVLGNREKALAWLRKPRDECGGLSPLALSKSKSGAHHVEELLGLLDSG